MPPSSSSSSSARYLPGETSGRSLHFNINATIEMARRQALLELRKQAREAVAASAAADKGHQSGSQPRQAAAVATTTTTTTTTTTNLSAATVGNSSVSTSGSSSSSVGKDGLDRPGTPLGALVLDDFDSPPRQQQGSMSSSTPVQARPSTAPEPLTPTSPIEDDSIAPDTPPHAGPNRRPHQLFFADVDDESFRDLAAATPDISTTNNSSLLLGGPGSPAPAPFSEVADSISPAGATNGNLGASGWAGRSMPLNGSAPMFTPRPSTAPTLTAAQTAPPNRLRPRPTFIDSTLGFRSRHAARGSAAGGFGGERNTAMGILPPNPGGPAEQLAPAALPRAPPKRPSKSHAELSLPVHLRQRTSLGEGAFGAVVCAEDDAGSLYAVKMLLRRGAVRADRARAYREFLTGRLLSRYDHPNICRYFEFYDIEGPRSTTFCMQLELCEHSLDRLPEQLLVEHCVPEPLLWEFLTDIATGLQYIHDCGLLHLDVKPANLLLKDGIVKLTDFGQSRLASDIARFDDVGEVTGGDNQFLSLECIALGARDPSMQIGPPADVYGLALTMITLATDVELPTEGENFQYLRGRDKSGNWEVLAGPISVVDRVTRHMEPKPPPLSLPLTMILDKMAAPLPRERAPLQSVLGYEMCARLRGSGARASARTVPIDEITEADFTVHEPEPELSESCSLSPLHFSTQESCSSPITHFSQPSDSGNNSFSQHNSSNLVGADVVMEEWIEDEGNLLGFPEDSQGEIS